MTETLATQSMNWAINKGCHPFWASVKLLGAPHYIILTAYLLFRKDSIEIFTIDILFIYLAISWSWIGLLSIWYYEHKLVPNFLNYSKKIIHSCEAFDFHEGISTLYKRLIIIVWLVFVVTSYLLVKSYCCKIIGFGGLSDPLYILSIISIGFQASLSGIGFYGCLNSFMLIYKHYKHCDLELLPYHADRKGGMSCYRDLSIYTTMLLCTGSIYIPILLTVTTRIGEIYAVGIYFLTVVFSLTLLFSFLIPTFLIYKKALLQASSQITYIGERLHNLYIDIVKKEYYTENEFYKHYLLRNIYQDLIHIDIYPINVKILTYLFTSVLFPIANVILYLLPHMN